MGSWDWDIRTGECMWDEGQYRIFGVESGAFEPTDKKIRPFIHPEDFAVIESAIANGGGVKQTFQVEARVMRPTGEVRWCICAAAMTCDAHAKVNRVSGGHIELTHRKEAEARRTLLVREVDHRARNTLALVQSIVRLT